MKNKFLVTVAALLLSANACAASATDEPKDEKHQFVFVGRLVSIEEAPDPCESKDECISFDSLYSARYEIVEPLVGTHPGREITFGIADHYGFPQMARYRHALLFVQSTDVGVWLHKYQGFAVHRLTDGQWGYCGGAREAAEDPSVPTPRPLPFAHDFGIVGEFSEYGVRQIFDVETFSIEDGRIRCREGLKLAELYEVVRKDPLRARGVVLPAWDERSQP